MSTVKGFKAATANFQRLMEKRDEIERKAHKQRMRARLLDTDIARVRIGIDELKKAKRNRGGARADLESARRAAKDIHLLESEKNRLMIATDRLDDAMRARRLKINEARLHRLSQDRVFSQMNRDLDEIKASLVVMIDTSNEKLEEKEKVTRARSQAAAVGEDHVLEFDAEFTGLSLELEDLTERQRSAFDSDTATASGKDTRTMSDEDRVKMHMRLEQLDEWIHEAEEFITECDQRTERLGDVFQLMMTRANVDNLDDLVALFRKNEADKFQIYTYIQHLNREIKHEDGMLVETKRQVEDFKVTTGRLDAEKRERMLSMSDELEHTHASTRAFNRSAETNMVVVKEMVNVAKRLANAVDSATAAMEPAGKGRDPSLGKPIDLSQLGEFVTEEAMTNCMGLVEHRTQHAIRMFSEVIQSDKGRDALGAMQAQQKAAREIRATSAASPGVRLPPASPTRTARSGFSATAVSNHDVARVLMEASKGPVVPKMDSPHGMTRLPTFSRLHVGDDDEYVPDERPMRRSELYQLAQQDLDGGALTLDSTAGAPLRLGGSGAAGVGAGAGAGRGGAAKRISASGTRRSRK